MRANSVQREPQIQNFWRNNKVYESCLQDETKVKWLAHSCLFHIDNVWQLLQHCTTSPPFMHAFDT